MACYHGLCMCTQILFARCRLTPHDSRAAPMHIFPRLSCARRRWPRTRLSRGPLMEQTNPARLEVHAARFKKQIRKDS